MEIVVLAICSQKLFSNWRCVFISMFEKREREREKEREREREREREGERERMGGCILHNVPLKQYCINTKTSQLSSKGCKLGLSVIAFEQGVIFIVPHLLWHGASVFAVSSERPPHFAYTTRTKGYWQPFLTQDPNGKKKFSNFIISLLI